MDAQGLITRTRDPANRRTHIVELTPAGEAAFLRLRDAATAFDDSLRNGLTDTDLDGLAVLLGRLAGNVTSTQGPAGPWPDLSFCGTPAALLPALSLSLVPQLAT
jgi:MarR family transcriptional regulator, transcriptional regulator for hemolysin